MFAAGRLTVRALICPRCAACTSSSPLLPHTVVVSLPSAGVKGASPLQLFLFSVFLSPEKEKRIGSDAVGKSVLRKQNLPDIIFHETFKGDKQGTKRGQQKQKGVIYCQCRTGNMPHPQLCRQLFPKENNQNSGYPSSFKLLSRSSAGRESR